MGMASQSSVLVRSTVDGPKGWPKPRSFPKTGKDRVPTSKPRKRIGHRSGIGRSVRDTRQEADAEVAHVLVENVGVDHVQSDDRLDRFLQNKRGDLGQFVVD